MAPRISSALNPRHARLALGFLANAVGFAACLAVTVSASRSSPAPADRGNDHRAIQRLLDADSDTLVIPAKHGGWQTGPLRLRKSRRVVIMLPGALIQAAQGAFSDPSDCLLDLTGVEDVQILGYGAELRMRKSEYRSGEWRHCLSIKDSRRITVAGLELDSSGGDGIYIGPDRGKPESYAERIRIFDCRIRDNRRQGISVISAKDLLIDGCRVTGTRGTPPSAGIDFEPDEKSQRLDGCRVTRSEFSGNQGESALIYLARLNAHSIPVSISFDACRFGNSLSGGGIRIDGFAASAVRGKAIFEECIVAGTGGPGLAVVRKPARGLSVVLRGCLFERVAMSPAPQDAGGSGHPIVLRADDARTDIGGVSCSPCQVVDSLDRAPISVLPAAGFGAYGIKATIHVRSGPYPLLRSGPGRVQAEIKRLDLPLIPSVPPLVLHGARAKGLDSIWLNFESWGKRPRFKMQSGGTSYLVKAGQEIAVSMRSPLSIFPDSSEPSKVRIREFGFPGR
jgi:hypothetical protein